MAHRNLSPLATILTALAVTSIAVIAATPASKADQDGTLALVNPHAESGYKTAAAEMYGNVVDDRARDRVGK